MDDIRLPMVSGTMDDISQEGDSSQDGDTPMDSMSSQVLYLKKNIIILRCLVLWCCRKTAP